MHIVNWAPRNASLTRGKKPLGAKYPASADYLIFGYFA